MHILLWSQKQYLSITIYLFLLWGKSEFHFGEKKSFPGLH